jgi:hypothetical protein
LACLQAFAVGRAQLSKAVYNFTSEQDVKLTVGYKARVNDKGDVDGVSVKPLWLASCDLHHAICITPSTSCELHYVICITAWLP